MIKKFNDFDKNINEGILDSMKRFISPSIEDTIKKMKSDIGKFKMLLKLSDRGDIDSFLEYIDLCEKNLNRVTKLKRKVKLEEEEYKKIEDSIIELITAINNTWPRRFKFDSAPDWFYEQIKRILSKHRFLADEYNLPNMDYKIKQF